MCKKQFSNPHNRAHTHTHAHTHKIHPQPTAQTQDGFHENKSIFIKSQYQW